MTFTVEVRFRLSSTQLIEAMRAVNTAYGFPDGVPLDATTPDALREAHGRLRAHYIGKMTVELDPLQGVIVGTGVA